MIDYFTVRTLQGVFNNDATEASPPMNLYMEHPDLVTGLFSQMTSEKGLIVLGSRFKLLTSLNVFSGLCHSNVLACFYGTNVFKRIRNLPQ